jgi:hypothetical protein
MIIAAVRWLAAPAIVCAGLASTPATDKAGPIDPRRAAPTEPLARPGVAAIVGAFKDYRLVALGEAHRNEQVHRFIATLLRDPRFLPDGGDLVVEFGNARYQGLMDRYISGESVPRDDLAHVWRDTVNILVWDAPVYERFFETVRSINQRRLPDRRLRVLLADPPIDWSMIHDRTGWERIAATRDRHAADVIDREVLARGHRALLLFGSGHINNEEAFDRYGKPNRIRSPNLAELLKAEHPGETLFVLADRMTVKWDTRLAAWRPPVLARLKGTTLGDLHVGPARSTPRLADLADAFLYLGPTGSLTSSTPAPAIYRDTVYLRELLRRNAIQGGANTTELQRLKAKYLDRKGESDHHRML